MTELSQNKLDGHEGAQSRSHELIDTTVAQVDGYLATLRRSPTPALTLEFSSVQQVEKQMRTDRQTSGQRAACKSFDKSPGTAPLARALLGQT